MLDPHAVFAIQFAHIQAPKLNSTLRKAISRFLTKRITYENDVDVQLGIKAISYANSFEATFLDLQVCCRLFYAVVKEVSHMTEDIIKAKLVKLPPARKPFSAKKAIANVKRRDASEPNACFGIIMLQASFTDLCKKQNWDFSEKAHKASIKHIVAVLEPP